MTRIGISICAMLVLLSCTKEVKPIQTLTRTEALRQACEDGSRRACYEQGMMYLSTDLVSDRRARRAFTRSCELKYGRGCFQLAKLVDLEPNSESAQPRSMRLYRKSCQFGYSSGCHMMATQAFIRSKTRKEMVNATDVLARLCDEADVAACMDYLRGRLALGLPRSEVLLTGVRSLCKRAAEPSDLNVMDCQRMTNERCAGPSREACDGTPSSESLVQHAACPKRDHEWIVSVVHVAMLECGAGFAGTLTLRFGSNGRQSTPRVTQTVSECVDQWIESIEILPLTTEGECDLKLQF